MLPIRQSQINAFAKPFVATQSGARRWGTRYARKWCVMREKALGFGITEAYDVQAFVDLTLAYSANFEVTSGTPEKKAPCAG